MPSSVRANPESSTLRLPAVSAAQVLAGRDLCLIDLRSPSEFTEDRLPGARNLPLFDDLERAVVGTLYKQVGAEDAFAEGLRRVRARLAGLVSEIALAAGTALDPAAALKRLELLSEGGQRALEGRLHLESAEHLPAGALVLHCWRGGLRSQAVTALLRCLGLDAYLLRGGYREYRASVTQSLERAVWPRAFVLRGLTGVGKTLVLREIERRRPGSTVDLEAAAQHRSSVLGMVGLQPVSQKAFDSALAARLAAGFLASDSAPWLAPAAASAAGVRAPQDPWFVVEGESRKVGNVTQPESLWRVLSAGTSIELTAPLDVRVQNLLADYLQIEGARPQLAQQLRFIEQRLGPKKYDGQLVALLESGREPELVRLLLEDYYDPLYRHSEAPHSLAASLDASDPALCADRVLEIMATLMRSEPAH